MYQTFFEILTEIAKAWRTGTRQIRIWLSVAGGLIALSLMLFALVDAKLVYREIGTPIAAALSIGAAIIILTIYIRQKSVQQDERQKRIDAVEKRYQDNPNEPHAAWDVARLKLEDYLDRNLSQVKAVFWLTMFVMAIGFVLIGIGVWFVYQSPTTLAPSIVAACAGTIINLIGASFLVVYRSTMEQAKDYVTILERINAVGMSVQILERIDAGSHKLKAQATADLSKQLLSLYSHSNITSTSVRPSARSVRSKQREQS